MRVWRLWRGSAEGERTAEACTRYLMREAIRRHHGHHGRGLYLLPAAAPECEERRIGRGAAA